MSNIWLFLLSYQKDLQESNKDQFPHKESTLEYKFIYIFGSLMDSMYQKNILAKNIKSKKDAKKESLLYGISKIQEYQDIMRNMQK